MKLLPVIVTVLPMYAEVGEMEVAVCASARSGQYDIIKWVSSTHIVGSPRAWRYIVEPGASKTLRGSKALAQANKCENSTEWKLPRPIGLSGSGCATVQP